MVSAAHFITAILCFLLVHGVAEKLRVGIITGPKDIEVPWNTAATFVCVVPCGETVDWYEVGKPTRLRTGQDGLQIHEDSTSCTENGNHTVSTLQINAEVVAERNGKAFQCATDYIVSICTGSACTTQELRIAFVSFMAQLIVLGTPTCTLLCMLYIYCSSFCRPHPSIACSYLNAVCAVIDHRLLQYIVR